MSLPPSFLDELHSRTSLAQVAGRKVVWDQKKSNPGKGDMWAQCPFHQEKTASFHVDDRKGIYYCFGCQAKGNAIGFVQQTENVDFMEAVGILAREAGMQIPARDPQAQHKADRTARLIKVMEQAVQHYRMQLHTTAGAAAREYLDRRGLDEAVQERWQIGFAPAGLFRHLTGSGMEADLIVNAGLAVKPDGGGVPYDRFRERIIFPIRDPRGRCIALGGRALNPDARAKYLNSPETELFDKGRTLFNYGPARAAAGKGQPLIVSEGYMDTIALAEAGFAATVAPLGTAITEVQLRLLWRIAAEPVIALDGDRAGLDAAMRLVDIALPLLESGKGLRFCLMPADKDPDDVIRQSGAAAMQVLLDKAEPMIGLLWRRETEGRNFDSPERRAALDRALRRAVAKIADPTLRRHYDDALGQLRWALFRPRRSKAGQGRRKPAAPVGPTQGARRSELASGDSAAIMREAVILAVLVAHPDLAAKFEGDLEAHHFIDSGHEELRHAVLRHAGAMPEEFRDRVAADVGKNTLEKLMSSRHVCIIPAIRPDCAAELAAQCVAEEIRKLVTVRGLEAEVAEAVHDPDGLVDEEVTWRLAQAAEARNRAVKSEIEDRTEYELGPNGARIRREEKTAFAALLKRIDHGRSGSRAR